MEGECGGCSGCGAGTIGGGGTGVPIGGGDDSCGG